MSRTAFALLLTAALTTPALAAPIGARLVDTGAQPNVTAKLVYNNGPMIQHVKIFMIFYAPNYPYKTQLVSFYQSILQSPYIDMLQEYDTTNYKIRRGSYIGLYEDTNTNTAKSVAPATYLQGLITAKKGPAPDADTLYMIYFPSMIDPTDPNGSPSCVKGGQFCAYHNSISIGGQNAYYGVMPDTVSGGSCVGGCGPSGFGGLSDVSSHEFVEAMTDADVGQNNLAWYDNANGEIGDICNGQSATVGPDTVQKEWSNQKNACIATNPMYTVNDFSVAVTPSTALNVPVGGMTTATVTLTKTAGNADTAALTATGLPTGVVASFSPTSATTAGGTSMVTVSAGPNAMIGAGKFTINVAGMTASHTQDVMINVVPPPDMAMAPDLAQPAGGGTGGTGGGGSGGSGGGTGTGGNGGSGGNGNNGGGASGCSIAGTASIGGVWTLAALLLFAFAFRRRRA
jgi:MYXO-CTERM domain-containing protein